jgi:hypothetical protein
MLCVTRVLMSRSSRCPRYLRLPRLSANRSSCFDVHNAGCRCSIFGPDRGTASLLGCLGQARFSFLFRVFVTHPGHASLRSLVDAVLAPLHAYVGSDVQSLALRRASRCAAAIFGFFHEPRAMRDDPLRIRFRLFRSCHASHLILTEFSAICPHPVE